MRPLSELRFIRDRVLAEVHANPPQGPLLGETPPVEVCKRGHRAMVQTKRRRMCRECDRQQKRVKR